MKSYELFISDEFAEGFTSFDAARAKFYDVLDTKFNKIKTASIETLTKICFEYTNNEAING